MPKTIYNNEEKFLKLYNKVFSNNYKAISEPNKEVLKDFLDLLRSEGLTHARRFKYLYFFKNLYKWLNKDILEASKEDLIKLAGIIKEQKYKPSTIRDYISAVKKLYKTITVLPRYEHLESLYFWLYDRRNQFYSTRMEKSKEKELWFTEDDVMSIITNADSFRNKCFLSIIATQGTRPEEILTLRKKDITEIENGLQMRISGKTGVRSLFVYEPFVVEYTSSYLQTIPKEQEYLFEFGIKMGNKILKEICKKIEINKRAYLYKLRKFAITRDRILCLSSGAMEQKHGWAKGTKVIAHYDKSISIDYRREIEERYGLVKDHTPKSKIITKICPRCSEKNPFDRSFCGKCSQRLDVTREEMAQLNEEERIMNELMQDEEFRSLVKRKLVDKV
ncbi:site-specific integrase [Candidatus Woesearchaeota archaeon]|nr:site-specific integrase [Candidatus Woesearchaeota archaeon]